MKVIELQSGFSSLVASKAFKAGDVLTILALEPRTKEPNRYTLQIDDELHGEPMPFEFRFVNHSCAPNISFDVDRLEVIVSALSCRVVNFVSLLCVSVFVLFVCGAFFARLVDVVTRAN